MKNLYLFAALILFSIGASAQCGTSIIKTNVTCFGFCNGTIAFTPANGTAPYSLSVNGVSVTPFASTYTMTSVCANSYHYVLTDAVSSCNDSGDIVISEPSQLNVFATNINATCGLANGSACTFILGGTPPFTFSWTPILGTDSCIGNLPAGIYSVAVSDSNHCIASVNTIISTSIPPTAAVSSSDVTCPGGNNGVATDISFGGTPPYTYSWSPIGSVLPNLSNLSAGTYYLTVTDINGCQDLDSVVINQPASFSNVLTTVNSSCTNGNDGTACISVTGSTPPYNYSWVPSGDSSNCIDSLSPGIYVVLIFDLNGCFDSAGVVITQSPLLSILNTTATTCNGGIDGSFCINASGGVLPFSYSIDGGITNQSSNCFTNLPAGTYSVTVMDQNTCTGNIAVAITEPPPISVNAGPDFMICFGDSIGTVCATAAGMPPFSYSWSTGPNDTLNCITGYTSGLITVVVTDSNGCSASDNIFITQAPPLNISISSIPPSCGQCDGITTAGANGAFAYLWTPGNITTPFLNATCSGTTYIVTVANVFGCVDTMSISYPLQCDSVWPGDADYDGVANNFDVLTLGVNYGSTGPVRSGATNTWTGQTCLNWSNTLSGGVNGKHSDCDGNGIVNAADTVPIYLNYGLLHPRMAPLPHQSSLPDLYLESVVDTSGPNEIIHVNIRLGTPGTPVPAIYGLAFTLTFDPSLVDTSNTMVNFSNSGLGTTGIDLLTFQYSDFSAGTIDVALSRTNHIDVVGFDSIIAVFDVVITDNVSAMSLFRMGIVNVKAITFNQTPLVFNLIPDSITIDPAYISVRSIINENSISVFPSPVHDQLRVVSGIQIEKAELINELGVTLLTMNVHQKIFRLNTDGIGNGIYFLQLSTAMGQQRKRVCILH